MKREFLSNLGVDEALIEKIMAENGKDVESAKAGVARQKEELAAANEALQKANETIAALEASKADADALQKQIDEYRQADEARKAEEKAAAERAELLERMDAAMGDRKLLHPRMRDLLAEDFKAALHDRANRGKSDAEIFDSITKDQGYFASQNPPAPRMPAPGDVSQFAGISDRAAFFKLSGADQARFKAERPNEFYAIFPQLRKE